MKFRTLILLSLQLLILNSQFLIVYGQPLVQQEWVRRYDDSLHQQDFTGGIVLDKFSNIYVTGWSRYDFNPDVITTIKYSSDGVQQWVATYPVNGEDAYVVRIVVDTSSNIYITGYYGSFLNGVAYYFLIKYTSNGVFQWFRNYGDGTHIYAPEDEIVDRQGNVYVIGAGIIILKYSPLGDTIWTRSYQEQGYLKNIGTSIAIDSTNNIIIGGRCNVNPQFSVDFTLLLKYSSQGDYLWSRIYNAGNGDCSFAKVGIDGNGYIFATGEGGNYPDILTIKYNSSGVQQWVRRFRGPVINGSNGASSLAIDNLNNIYVTGVSQSNTSIEDFLTIKYNANGDSLWVRRYDNPTHQNDVANDIELDSSANVYVNGWSIDSTGFDITTIKYSTDGIQQWIMNYPGKNNFLERSIAIDKIDNVYVIGDNTNNGTLFDFITVKYNQIIGVTPVSNEVPRSYKLYQNYPNPFNPTTKIEYALPKSAKVVIKVYDILGRMVKELVNEQKDAGYYTVKFDGTSYASGVYFYRINAGEFTSVKKMVLVK